MNTYRIDYVKPTGNAIKIEVTGNSIFNKKYIYTTLEHIVNLLELEEYYKYAVKTEYEKETNNNKR